MIDFHNHILPNIDDGSKSFDMSIEMLSNASKQGITEVVNTVHYQHPKFESKRIDFDRINSLKDELQNELENRGIPIKLHLGAEVFYFPNLLEILDLPLVTIGKGKYMLIEFYPQLIPDSHKQQFFDLKMAGVTPIIAHPERYKFVQENIAIVTEWLEAGCLIQIDAGSPLGILGNKSKTTSIEIIKNNWFQIIGSDAHDNNNRRFCLKRALDFIRNFVEDPEKYVWENPKKIINGEPISVDIDYNKSVNHNRLFNNLFKKKN